MRNNILLMCVVFVCAFFFGCLSARVPVPGRVTRAVADFPSFELEKMELGINTGMIGTKVEQKPIVIAYHPRTDEVSVDFSYALNNVTLILDPVARSNYYLSLMRYIDDFENRALKTRGNMKSAYEAATGLLKWGVITQNGEAIPELRFGYLFVKKAVYFTITIHQAENYSDFTKEYIKNSPPITLCLTISQAKKLAELLSAEYLRNALSAKINVSAREVDIDNIDVVSEPVPETDIYIE